MKRNVHKIAIYIAIFLGLIFLSGCNSQTPTSKSQASPTLQTDQAGGEKSTEAGSATTETTEPVEPEAPASTQEVTTVEQTDPVLILVADDITTLEPYRMVTIHPDASIASHLWDTLTWLNDELEVEPSLAESWRLVNNFTWEFKLHQGVSFHNGEPVNAEAVRFSIERAGSIPASLETFAHDVDLKEVEIVDEYTLRLTTSQPVANLPYHLANLEILPPLYYSETGSDQLAIAPVGSGPYRLTQKWQPGEPVVLEAVPDYWQGNPAFSSLTFKTVSLAQERLAALRVEGQAIATELEPIQAEQWDIPESRLEVSESSQRIFIGIRAEAGSPFADKRVRQALNYGVDVAQLVTNHLEGSGTRYGSWVNPPLNNPDLTLWPYDPELARTLLAEAGYREGFTTTLHTPKGVYYQDVAVAEAIAQQLGEIGIGVEVETVDWTTYTHELLNGNTAPLFLLGLNSRGDGLEDLKNLSADFPFNATGWQNQTFEETVKRAVTTFNENSRVRLIYEAQSIAYDEAPWLWLWRPYDFYGVSQNLDWTPRRDGLVYLYQRGAASSAENSSSSK